MKRILIRGIIIVLSILIVDRIINNKMSELYENNFCKHSGGDLNYYLKFQKADTLFQGSSRVLSMIDVDYFSENVLSITSIGKHFFYNAAVVHILEKYNKLPKKMLILNVEAEDIYIESRDKLIENTFFLKYYYDKVQFVKEVIDSRSPFEKYKFMLASYKFNGENFLLFTNQFQNICDDQHLNFIPISSHEDDVLRVKNGIKLQSKLKYTKYNPDFLPILKKVNVICTRNKIKLVILYGPHYKYLKKFKIASSTIHNFCTKNDISYLDFNTKSYDQFRSIHNWADLSHLNRNAALEYTKLVKEELRKLDLSRN